MTTTMKTSVSNGFQRKTLADQLDRLDRILDGLDGALQGAITDAVKVAVSSAVAEAVRATLLEIVANPSALALLHGGVVPPNQAAAPTGEVKQRSSILRRSGKAIAGAWSWTLAKAKAMGHAIVAPVRNAYQGAVSTYRQVNAMWRLRSPILIALGIGALIGVIVGYASAPWVAGVVSAVGAAGSALAIQMSLWARRLFATMSMH
jgi:hypothetical protein